MGDCTSYNSGGIVVFVIRRLHHKYNQETLGKKKSEDAQSILDSSIPLGMLFGSTIGTLLSVFSPISLLMSISLGAGFGYLIGYFIYEIIERRKSINNWE
ncbi:hypothetical protein [Bacillus sp. JCM 19034]|uniref:hypothetical protein n=1 Tax=Bacillus sp. JCM 19034 TaxID=1481928 RepID=UPI000785D045